jgi:hypothetical protein
MENVSTVLTQTLFLLLVLALPLAWYFDRRRKRSLSGHYARLKFRLAEQEEIQELVRAGRFTLMEKRWVQAGRTSEFHVGQYEGLDVAQFTLNQADGSQAGRNQTVTLFKAQQNLPSFVLRPESVADKLMDRFRGADIDFDSHPGFSESYQLESQDEAAVRAFFDHDLLNYFEENAGYTLESNGSDVLIFREYKRVSNAADIDVQLRLAHSLFQRLLERGQH